MFFNLTPHAVVVIGDGSEEFVYPPTGVVARIVEVEDESSVKGVSEPGIVGIALGSIEGLPRPSVGTFYIVSRSTAIALKAAGEVRKDVFYPFDQVRNNKGHIIGWRSLAHLI